MRGNKANYIHPLYPCKFLPATPPPPYRDLCASERIFPPFAWAKGGQGVCGRTCGAMSRVSPCTTTNSPLSPPWERVRVRGIRAKGLWGD